jgi:hypothetical protein
VGADGGDRVHELLFSLVALCFGGISARWWHIMGYEVVLFQEAESGSASVCRIAGIWMSMHGVNRTASHAKKLVSGSRTASL